MNRDTPTASDWAYASNGTGGNFTWTNGAQNTKLTTLPAAVVTTDQSSATQTMSASISGAYLNRGIIGQVGDVITFNKVLTAAQRRVVEEYLSRKWGVAIAPPASTGVVGTTLTTTTVRVNWTAPTWDGGLPITGYTVTAVPAAGTCTTTTTTCTVTGLSNTTNYTFTVTATNAAGIGPASTASVAVKG